MNLNLTTATRIGLNLSAVLGIAALLKLGAALFVPLVLAVLLASVLYPAARFLHDFVRVPWFFSCVAVLLAAVAVFLVVVAAFAVAIPQTLEGLPMGDAAWQEQYRKIQNNLQAVLPSWVGIPYYEDPNQSYIYRHIRDYFSNSKMSENLPAIALSTGARGWQAILIMFITLFLLLEGQMLADKVRAIFGPSRETQNRVSTAIAQMASAIRTYLIWRTIVNLGLAVVLGAVYNAAGLKYWYLWALLVAVLSYVPYLGTIAAGIPPFLDAMLFVDPIVAVGIGLFYVGVVTFEGYIIVPWVMGRSMDLNATTVLLACLFWEELWGMSGLFLAMPIMAALKAVCMQVDGWQGWGELMGSGPAKPLALLETDGRSRIDSIAEAAASGDATVVMDHRDEKGGSPSLGDPKSDAF
jgi:predicted PurR-regulated permease PerM